MYFFLTISKTITFTILLLIALNAFSQSPKDSDKALLQNLLDEREAKFKSYSDAIEKRSGIFGNQTKKDIRKSNEVLIDIVKTDNRIISSLYHVVDFRNFQKVNMSYDNQKKEELVAILQRATDTLSKQVLVLKDSNRALESKSNRLKLLIFSLLLLIGWLYYKLRQKGKPDRNNSEIIDL